MLPNKLPVVPAPLVLLPNPNPPIDGWLVAVFVPKPVPGWLVAVFPKLKPVDGCCAVDALPKSEVLWPEEGVLPNENPL